MSISDKGILCIGGDCKYAVLKNSIPLSTGKQTAQDAIAVAASMGVEVSGLAWDGRILDYIPLCEAMK